MSDTSAPKKGSDHASSTYFAEGTAAPVKAVSMLIVDLRQLELTPKQGAELQQKVSQLIVKELEGMGVDLSACSSHDLSKSVIGFSIE